MREKPKIEYFYCFIVQRKEATVVIYSRDVYLETLKNSGIIKVMKSV